MLKKPRMMSLVFINRDPPKKETLKISSERLLIRENKLLDLLPSLSKIST